MTILLTGSDGQLGRHLAPRLADLGRLVTTARRGGDRPCDLSDSSMLDALLNEIAPSVIVNAAAYTAVDAAEENAEAADLLNRWLPETLARWSRANGALLVHYSTDYVFHGNPGRAWNERDETAPVSVYGRSKCAGEKAILASGANAVILRTAWLYSACPGNFLSAILARAGQGEALRVVCDQVGSPTWAGSLATMTAEVLGNKAKFKGATILHAADRGGMSWHEFATFAVTMAAERGLIENPVLVDKIDSSQWPQQAARPAWSVLDVTAIESVCGKPMLTMEQALSACLEQWNSTTC